jgi:hypothetical protein
LVWKVFHITLHYKNSLKEWDHIFIDEVMDVAVDLFDIEDLWIVLDGAEHFCDQASFILH